MRFVMWPSNHKPYICEAGKCDYNPSYSIFLNILILQFFLKTAKSIFYLYDKLFWPTLT